MVAVQFNFFFSNVVVTSFLPVFLCFLLLFLGMARVLRVNFFMVIQPNSSSWFISLTRYLMYCILSVSPYFFFPVNILKKIWYIPGSISNCFIDFLYFLHYLCIVTTYLDISTSTLFLLNCWFISRWNLHDHDPWLYYFHRCIIDLPIMYYSIKFALRFKLKTDRRS